jgi:hypothetical protein
MTVIAYDGVYVAADTMITNEAGTPGRCRKLYVHNTKVLAISGTADHGEAMRLWYMHDAKPVDFPHVPGGDKSAYLYVFEYMKPVLCFQSFPAPVIFPMDMFTAGCGGDIARAALHMGGDAIRAVEVACALNVYCGGPVEYVDLQALHEGEPLDVKTHVPV